MSVNPVAPTGTNADDETLMTAYAQGNAAAFDLLYHKHKCAVLHFFIKQGVSCSQSEELAHDTWLKLIKARESYFASAKFTTFLFTIARRLLLDFVNKKSHLQEQSIEQAEMIDPQVDTNSEQQLKNWQLRQRINQFIASLPTEQKEVFVLKQEMGFSLEEVATIVQSDKESVKSRWRYAIAKLRKRLISDE